jgi:transcriptional regulator with XRE-family HTH domain
MRRLTENDCALAKAVGVRVAELRLLRGWPQSVLAERAGMGRPNVARLERGIHVPSLSVLRDVAHALGFDLASLLAGVDQRAPRDSDDELRRTA